MNSTDRAPLPALRSFFLERLLPAARHARAENGPFFPRGFDAGAASYFVNRERTTMRPADFELPRLTSPAELAAALDELWRLQGRPGLSPLTADMAGWMESLEERESQTGEVSPFIYVMY